MNDDDRKKERLGKLIALAKRGVGGEKQTALRMVRSLCKKLDLNFDDVMGEEESKREFHLDFARNDFRLALHVIIRYAFDGDGTADVAPSISHTRLYFTTTMERYIETAHALEVLSRQYRKEQKRMRSALWHAFLSKHELYATKTVRDDKPPKMSEEEMRARRMGGALANSLEDAEIRKTLPPASAR